MSASRELSRATAREAEAYAKLIFARQSLSRAISSFRIYFPDEPLPSKIPFYNNSLLERNFLDSRNTMLAANPEILQANESLRASVFNSKLVDSRTLPRLDLEIRGSQYNLSDQSDEYDLYSGVNLSYDLYSGGRNSALKSQASAEVQVYQNNRDSLLRNLSAELSNSIKNIKLIPESLAAYQNAYLANKESRYYANEQFETSNVLLLDLLQTERDFLESSEALIESMRSSQIENYIFLKLTGELGDEFKIILN
jgi:adhesin transport system outer membrane protein